jgi:hypothetical protein
MLSGLSRVMVFKRFDDGIELLFGLRGYPAAGFCLNRLRKDSGLRFALDVLHQLHGLVEQFLKVVHRDAVVHVSGRERVEDGICVVELLVLQLGDLGLLEFISNRAFFSASAAAF